MKIPSIIFKNILLILKNKSYLLIILSLPALLVLVTSFILGTASIRNTPISVSSGENTEQIISLLSDEGFNSIEEIKEEKCIEKVKMRESGACIKTTETKVEAVVDNSNPDTAERINSFFQNLFLERKVAKSEDVLMEIEKERKGLLKFTKKFKERTADMKEELLETRKDLVETRKELKETKNTYEEFNETIYPLLESLEDLEKTYGTLESNKEEIKETIKEEEIIRFNRSLESLDKINNSIGNTTELIEEIKKGHNKIEEADEKISKNIETIDNTLNIMEESKEEIEDIEEGMKSEADYGWEEIEKEDAFSVNSNNRNQLIFPKLVTLIISFVSLYISTIFILVLVKSKGYLREMMVPSSNFSFLISSFIVLVFVVSLFTIAIFSIGRFYPGVKAQNNLLLAGISLLLISLFVEIGMIFGYSIDDENIAISFATFLLILLVILSGSIVPTHFFQEIPKTITSLNPINIAEESFSKILLTSMGIDYLKTNFIKLGIMITALIPLLFISKRISQKNVLK